MQTVEQIKPENFEKTREIYEDFRKKALVDYEYCAQPLEFEYFAESIEDNSLGGLVIFEGLKPTGILIYYFENHKVIEINVIHSVYDRYENNRRYVLLEKLLELLKDRNDWRAISYAMLGRQDSFVKDIALLGFKFVGQSIVKFDFQSPIAFRIYRNAQIPEIGDYKLAIWDEKYREQVIVLANSAFKNTKNVYFDPRFLTYEGTKYILNMILTDRFGKFLPSQCRLLLLDGNLEGFCLTTMTAEDKINIPLIATRKDTRNRGMGKLVLKSVLAGFIKLIGEKKISLSEINATTDTDNYPAVRMYRRLGFKEDSFYPHSYLKNKNYHE